MYSRFLLTDGVTSIDFLALNKHNRGIGVDKYAPGRPNLKSGGIWQESPLASGRQLVYATKGTVNDALTLRMAFSDHQQIIDAQNQFDLLIDKAIAYWTTDYQEDPVWLEIRVHGETSSRYALLHNMSFDEYSNPFEEPFVTQQPPYLWNDIVLGIERSTWQSNPPLQETDVSLSHEFVSTAIASGLHIGNMRSDGLTHVYRYESGIYSSNLIGSTLPYTILAIPTAVNDALYFGADHPFFGVAFDIATGYNATSYTLVWEYYTGSWSTLTTISDETDSLSDSGIAAVQWTISTSSWTKTTINSRSKYWVRARISAVSGATVAATQQNRDIYALTVPYVEIASSQVNGSMDALARIQINMHGGQTSSQKRAIVGLRSYDRGANFTAYINPQTADNPTGVSVTIATGIHNSDPALTADGSTPTGYKIRWTAASGDTINELFRITFDSAICREYYGRYRLFVRLTTTDTAAAGQMRYRVRYYFSGNTTDAYTGATKTIPSTSSANDYILVDLGYIQLPPTQMVRSDEFADGFEVLIDADTPSGKIIDIIDVIFMPSDEFSCQVSGDAIQPSYPITELLDIDSVTHPKYQMRALSRLSTGTQSVIGTLTAAHNNEAILHASAQQRYWFLLETMEAQPNIMADIAISKTQRYHHLRGD